MQFTSTLILGLAALATAATQNTVHFINQDSTDRTIYFTPTAGASYIPSLPLPGLSKASTTFPTAWIGNWHSVSAGAPNVTGMLGEVTWDGYAGANYFDVSAIVSDSDTEGVKQIYPLEAKTPVSGCQDIPCPSQYNHADDVATLSTTENELVCLVGNVAAERRHARDFAVRK